MGTLNWFYCVYFQQAFREITCHSYILKTVKKLRKGDAGSIHFYTYPTVSLIYSENRKLELSFLATLDLCKLY